MTKEERDAERRAKWHRDNLNDWVIEAEDKAQQRMVRGRVVRCHVTRRWRERFWRTKNRWLLIVNDHTYGFWNSLKEAQAKFEKDCMPKNVKCPDCGHLIGSPQCCENDEELWK